MNRKMIGNIVVILSLVACAPLTPAGDSPRPATWAAPVAGDVVKNLYRLDARVYRSAQPDAREMAALERFGIREVLNLRHFHTDDDEAKGTRLKLHHVPMDAGKIRDEDVIAALRIIRDANGPILIHCWHGSDRTGVIAAMYRIVNQGWSKEEALEEMTKGGYGHHAVIYDNIPAYVEAVDVAKIRRALE